ncbi:MAG: periplasmic heavy metal sensor [Alphaproteobacteria bacterium]|nr:periplasmic heavy metal sensor [Alphaproteobacteria bacterium]MBU1512815.1 periplasmic heavy metal sensor [Alphaproteobacteria bacterium]MBU2093991.1 periplasmic heavy metal sensor [Alphaproteobacteria bacterium]MBU2149981.1 periplasmic heavy metal sensor [Alphaproteobacteria bacterium]MBU2306478.1 periplasmic heavy metal sensor [Alphaproteobacteria bacterium]
MIDRPILHGALFASLALNVFVGGAFVGSQLTKAKEPPAAVATGVPRSPVVMAVRALPPEHQASWRAQNPDYTRTYGPKVREARRLTRETMRGFGAEPFDTQAAVASLARARDLEHESRVAMDRRLVAFAATLPQAERAAFGEALARPRVALGRGAGEGRRLALPDR